MYTRTVIRRAYYAVLQNVAHAASNTLKPNIHRRRDETVESRRVGIGGVYMNSQLAHDDC